MSSGLEDRITLLTCIVQGQPDSHVGFDADALNLIPEDGPEFGRGHGHDGARDLMKNDGVGLPRAHHVLVDQDSDRASVRTRGRNGRPFHAEGLENLFLQGLDHRNWLDSNKMAIKFMLDGPSGRRIDTRKRVRLLVGFFGDAPQALFSHLRNAAIKRDRHLSVDFVRFSWGEHGELRLA